MARLAADAAVGTGTVSTTFLATSVVVTQYLYLPCSCSKLAADEITSQSLLQDEDLSDELAKTITRAVAPQGIQTDVQLKEQDNSDSSQRCHHQHCSSECSLSAIQAEGGKGDEAVPASRLSDKVA